MNRKVTVLDYLEENYRSIAEKTAVSDESGEISWGELRNRSLALSEGILSRPDMEGRKIPIVIFMEKSIAHVISIYGCLYSGNFYVPVDINTPEDRLKSILSTLKDYRVLTDEKNLEHLKNIVDDKYILLIGELLSAVSEDSDFSATKKRLKLLTDFSLMYIIFTSGSTGTPKGVAVRHRSVMDYIESFMDEIGMEREDVCGNQTPFYADMSLKDLYMTLASGAELCIIPTRFFSFPLKLLQYMEEKRISYCMWVPTVYRIVAQFKALSKLRPSKLRTVCFSGETMPLSVFEYWRENYPDIDFWQLYGPSEITGSCSFYKVDNRRIYEDIIPIGKPYRNTGMILMDNEEIIPLSDTNRKGEICVYGSCLAAGYYNDDERTEASFSPLPGELGYKERMYHTGDLAYYDSEGNFVFAGRADYQIKHMGRRMEPGEIEAAAEALDGIDACCLIHNKEKDDLILYYIGGASAKDISNALRAKLPSYMLPNGYRQTETLPLLPNGKVNRKELDAIENEKGKEE